MKTCKYCHTAQEEDKFEIAAVIKGKVYRRLKCRRCKQDRANERVRLLQEWLEDYKKAHPCARCGFADYRALQFHHKSGQDKDFNVSNMIRSGYSRKSILREIGKCIVLCSNCHQIEHYDKVTPRSLVRIRSPRMRTSRLAGV